MSSSRDYLYLNNRGESAASFPASVAKQEFRRVLDQALQTGVVTITHYDDVKAVVLSAQEYQALVARGEGRLASLRDRFDAQLARMQEPGMRSRMQAAFDAPPGAAARKRR